MSICANALPKAWYLSCMQTDRKLHWKTGCHTATTKISRAAASRNEDTWTECVARKHNCCATTNLPHRPIQNCLPETAGGSAQSDACKIKSQPSPHPGTWRINLWSYNHQRASASKNWIYFAENVLPSINTENALENRRVRTTSQNTVISEICSIRERERKFMIEKYVFY
jgi:hypothetical protein